MFIAAFIYNSQKAESTKMSTNREWIKIVTYPYNRTLFSHEKEVLMGTTMRMNLKNVMLSESSQSQKASYFLIPLV